MWRRVQDRKGGFTFYRHDGLLIPEMPSPQGGSLDYAITVLTPVHASAEASIPPPPADPSLN